MLAFASVPIGWQSHVAFFELDPQFHPERGLLLFAMAAGNGKAAGDFVVLGLLAVAGLA